MDATVKKVAHGVTTAQLRAAVEEGLRADQVTAGIASIERKPSAYRTSFAIEELDVALNDGTRLPLLVKYVGRDDLLDAAQRAKPSFLYDPVREIAVYQSVLADSGLGTARCYATRADAAAGQYWLILEKFDGVELYQVGEIAVWERAAEWLARMHSRYAGRVAELEAPARLLRYDAALLHRWAERAVQFVREAEPSATARLRRLAERYNSVADHLMAMPSTLLHGEFYASNVLVSPSRVCPVDWELAAIGPGLIDLAALTAGKWTEAERRTIAAAYHAALAGNSVTLEQMLESLDYCRLHLAVQWLGWSSDWTPPREHAHDWLADAIELAERLGV